MFLSIRHSKDTNPHYHKRIVRIYLISTIFIIHFLLLIFTFLLFQRFTAEYDHQLEMVTEKTYKDKEFYLRQIVDLTIQNIEMDRESYLRDLESIQSKLEEEGIEVSIENLYNEEELEERIADRIRAISLADKGYIWVNEILNYEGGKNYAVRRVHPNLVETEGRYLSTEIMDNHDNTPYLTELEGIKKEGEIMFSYWFQKKDSHIIAEKLTFAKLYPDFDWIIATGVYLDDLTLLIEKEEKVIRESVQKEIMKVIIISMIATALSLLATFLLNRRLQSILLYYEKEVEEGKESLQMFNKTLESTVQERTEAYQKAKSEFQELYDNSTDLYFTAELETGYILRCNRTFKNSVEKSETLIGSNFRDFFREIDAGTLNQAVTVLNDQGKVQNVELFFKVLPKKELFTLVNMTLLSDCPEKKKCFQASIRDMTALRDINFQKSAMEKKLQQSRRLESLGQMAGNMAHDLNNILAPILGYAELGKESCNQTEPLRKYFNAIFESAQKASVLSRRILSYSKQDIKNSSSIDVNGLIMKFKELISPELPPGKNIVCEYKMNIPEVTSNRDQLLQVLENLVQNAVEATGEKGSITISTNFVAIDESRSEILSPQVPPGGYIVLSVRDDGVGVAEKDLPKLLDPFYSTGVQFGGAGLGLSICYGIVKKNRGAIGIESRKGEGTTVSIYLPPKKEEQEAGVNEQQPAEGVGSLKNKSILVVDDNEDVLSITRLILEKTGADLKFSNSPDEALGIAREWSSLELLLTDVSMPGMNGLDLYKAVLKDNPRVKVLFMSGYTQSILQEEHYELIDKPFSSRALINHLLLLLNKS